MFKVGRQNWQKTVDKWFGILDNIHNTMPCSFCVAREMRGASCSECPMFLICRPVDSPFMIWCHSYSDSTEEGQAILEILEALYDYGVDRGFITSERR